MRLESANDRNIYCENIEKSSYAENRGTNDEQLDEILIAHGFQEEHEKSKKLVVAELCKQSTAMSTL